MKVNWLRYFFNIWFYDWLWSLRVCSLCSQRGETENDQEIFLIYSRTLRWLHRIKKADVTISTFLIACYFEEQTAERNLLSRPWSGQLTSFSWGYDFYEKVESLQGKTNQACDLLLAILLVHAGFVGRYHDTPQARQQWLNRMCLIDLRLCTMPWLRAFLWLLFFYINHRVKSFFRSFPILARLMFFIIVLWFIYNGLMYFQYEKFIAIATVVQGAVTDA